MPGMRVFADFHTHTVLSHGKGTVAENARAAAARGLLGVGITDHGPANWFGVGIRDLTSFDLLLEQVESCRGRFGNLAVLAGAEANIVSYDGDLDVPPPVQRRLDLVLAGFHTQITPKSLGDAWRFVGGAILARLDLSLRRRARTANTKAVAGAMARNKIDIITHPGLKVPIDTPELARASARYGVALEINARHGVHSLGFVRAAARAGAVFAISSDAHRPCDVGRLAPGVRVAERARLGPGQVINARFDGGR
ncbi:MAG: PHP domain-containing protein [Patescibacteria group bacterium]